MASHTHLLIQEVARPKRDLIPALGKHGDAEQVRSAFDKVHYGRPKPRSEGYLAAFLCLEDFCQPSFHHSLALQHSKVPWLYSVVRRRCS